jgi:hypothetical protein
MSAAIKPGDLVAVVRATLCCGSTDAIGKIGTVEPNPSWARCYICDSCGAYDYDPNLYVTIKVGGYRIETLKKIDPPALAEDTEEHRELEAV